MRERTRLGMSAFAGALWLTSCLASCADSTAMRTDAGLEEVEAPPDLAPPSCSGTASFATIRRQILSNCEGYGCHLSAPYAGGLNLTSAAAYASLVGPLAMAAPSLQRVQPGEPLASFLWRKLDNQLSKTINQGLPMPVGAENFWTPLRAEQRALVYCWILAGAENN